MTQTAEVPGAPAGSSLVDPHTARLETLPSLRHTLWDAGLDDVVSQRGAQQQDGGRPPWNVFRRALREGFHEVSATGSLRVLRHP